MIQTEWEKLPQRFCNIELHEFVVMPNHFHGILEIVTGTAGSNIIIATNETAPNVGATLVVAPNEPAQPDEPAQPNKTAQPNETAPIVGAALVVVPNETAPPGEPAPKDKITPQIETGQPQLGATTRVAPTVFKMAREWPGCQNQIISN